MLADNDRGGDNSIIVCVSKWKLVAHCHILLCQNISVLHILSKQPSTDNFVYGVQPHNILCNGLN